MNLQELGWEDHFAHQFAVSAEAEHVPGRVAAEYRGQYRVLTELGVVSAEVTGKLRHEANGLADYPSVGDWVILSVRAAEGRASIHKVLQRKSCFSRKVAGKVLDEQVVAANIDTVFLVMALNQDFNLRRLERAMILAWESGSTPVIVLSKADLCDDVPQKLAEVQGIAPGATVHVVSAVTGEGLRDLNVYLGTGQTVALLGSSGAGKSTLVNQLLDTEAQRTGAVRTDDDRGRHTTTHRELFAHPAGGWIIDTPGMRELQLWEAGEGLQQTFEDIEALAPLCRFNDCTHDSEPGCAVQAALAAGELPLDRLQNYRKMLREMAFLERKLAVSEQRANRRKNGNRARH